MAGEYADIREQLELRRKELTERLAAIALESGHATTPLHPDFAEQAVERETEEVMDALDAQGRVELAAIKRALARIEGGSFGECVSCGASIPKKRLEILPFSDHCVSCAEQ